ncbi:MAG: metallophosphoesterase family protein [Myxococcales bacterium]|nr:metallophosphoesterase family protein [Myxococcales bacterium]
MPTPLGKQPPAARPIALLSDIHGNLRALEAVLSTLEPYDIGTWVVAGDSLLGGDDPLGVWRRLSRLDALVVRGLSDTALATVDATALTAHSPEEQARLEAFRATREALGDLIIEQLRRLPLQRRVPLIDGSELLVVHGSPSDPTAAIDHTVDDDELRELLDDDPADLVVCGAAHVPFLRDVDGTRVVGLGSVGDAPEGEVAHFGVIRPRMEGPEVLLEHVRYR